MTDSSNTPAQFRDEGFYDLITQGLGWLNFAREIPVPRGEPYLRVKVNALVGPHGKPRKVPYDVIVSGAEAQRLVRQYMEAINTRGGKVLAGFTIGDTEIHPFTYESGDRKGTENIDLTGHLLFISWMKVGGVRVYTAPSRTANTEEPQENSTPRISPQDEVPASDQAGNGADASESASSLAEFI